VLEHLTINPQDPDLAALEPALAVLRHGGVVAYPTDTLYGLAADPRVPQAVQRVFEIKGRSEQQSIPLIAATVEQARALGHFSALAARLADRFWPGPLTLIVQQKVPLAPGVAQQGTVAVRVPDHPIARALAAGLGFAITSTSANRSGAQPCATAEEVINAVGASVSIVVDGGPTRGGSPSTIVDVTGAVPSLVRAGAVPWERVLESLR
jgi:L-threonylcarbamoyladenylate synthase